MRINAYNNSNTIGQVQNSKRVNKTKSTNKISNGNSQDKFEISSVGKDYQMAKQAVLNTPEIRQDRVNDIKARLNAGTYNVSDDDLIDKLLSKYFDE